MRFGIIDIIVVLVYLIGIAILGLYQSRKIKGSGDYFAGGRKFSKFLMIMHSLGTGTSAEDPVAVTGAAFQKGFSGVWYTFIYLFVTPFYWIIAPFFRRSRYLTTTDFFESRFGPGLGVLYTVMGVITFTIYIGGMLKSTGTIAAGVTQGAMPEWLAILAMTVVFVAYGMAGGLIATVVTEAVQGLLIVVMSLLLVPFGLARVGGFSGLHNLVDSARFSLSAPHELSLIWIISASIISLIGVVAQPHVMEVFSAGKTEWEGRVGFTYGSMIKRFCAFGWMLTGVIVLALVAQGTVGHLGHREEAFGVALRVLLPVGFTGLMLAAILAAQMSTLSAFMVAASALLSRNIYRRWIHPDATDRQVVSVARFAGLIVVVLGVGFAFLVPGVAEALTYFWAVASFTGLFIWFGVLWRRTNATGAWASFIVMVLIWLLVGPVGIKLRQLLPAVDWLGMHGDKSQLHMLLISYLPAGVVALIIGSVIGKERDKKKIDDFYMLLKTPVGREQELIEAGVGMVYAGNTQGHPWELKHPRLVNILGFVVAFTVSTAFLGLLYLLSRIGA
ncbi:MAG: hypothetical protein A2Z18_03925 [Armatimonadetes bacterium RBG_16_58_9]|nr:MAG: hypothetical protein A2Z18_03925 [Armatimonadetes bacterium RBG_16_58_9]